MTPPPASAIVPPPLPSVEPDEHVLHVLGANDAAPLAYETVITRLTPGRWLVESRTAGVDEIYLLDDRELADTLLFWARAKFEGRCPLSDAMVVHVRGRRSGAVRIRPGAVQRGSVHVDDLARFEPRSTESFSEAPILELIDPGG